MILHKYESTSQYLSWKLSCSFLAKNNLFVSTFSLKCTHAKRRMIKYCSGLIWPVFTFESSKNTSNTFILAWNLTTFPKSDPEYAKISKPFLYFYAADKHIYTLRVFRVKLDPYLFNKLKKEKNTNQKCLIFTFNNIH